MRLAITIILVLAAATVAFMLLFRDDPESSLSPTTGHSGQIKAVHYFASSWPKTFWGDFERSAVETDLVQIKEDGFNTVILVVPWLGFETGFEDGSPEPSPMYERLDWLLAQIIQSGLDFGLRVSFPHSFDPDNGIGNWDLCKQMFVDENLRNAWVRYIGRLAGRIEQHRTALRLAFFSWEDFFCPYEVFPKLPEEERRILARDSGYQDWLADQYTLPLVSLLHTRNFESMESVPVPERKSPAFWLFLQFVDQFLVNRLLEPARQVLPELAMEVRVDKDPVYVGDEILWAGHDLALADTRMRGSYWGAYYGAQNQGEVLTASEALRNFEYMLDQVSGKGKNTAHVVEQFNFVDNTPGFAGRHARIDEKDIPAFLKGAAELLREKSSGYGLWAYRDYADSALFNGSFELGIRGWSTHGDLALVTNSEGDQALRLQGGASISQSIAPFEHFVALGLSERLHFCVNAEALAGPGTITLLLDGTAVGNLTVGDGAWSCIELDAAPVKQADVVFSLGSDSEVEIDDLRFFTFVQRLNVYDENGQPGPLRDIIRQLNNEWLGD